MSTVFTSKTARRRPGRTALYLSVASTITGAVLALGSAAAMIALNLPG